MNNDAHKVFCYQDGITLWSQDIELVTCGGVEKNAHHMQLIENCLYVYVCSGCIGYNRLTGKREVEGSN